MAHKIDFKTYLGSYGVFTTPKQHKNLCSKLIKIGFERDRKDNDDTNSIWIDPENKSFECYSLRKGELLCNIVLTPKQLHAYLNKLIKEGSDN